MFDSELLPIILFSTLNLFMLFTYWLFGKVEMQFAKATENKIIKILSTIGFGGNIVVLILCILIIAGFGVIP